MPRVNLIGGSYAAASLAAAAQICLNLYPEPVPQTAGEAVQYVDLPTPGLSPFAGLPPGDGRALYTCSTGDLIAVCGSGVYQITAAAGAVLIGTLSSTSGRVWLADNALVLFVVDGSSSGWTATLPAFQGGTFGPLVAETDPAFYGSRTLAVLDTYFLFVQPSGAQWYVSQSNDMGNTTPDDPLYVASETSLSQQIVGLAVVGQSIWLLGTRTPEIWFDAGESDFPFQRYPGIAPGAGCMAAATIASDSQRVLWLGQDQAGIARVYLGFQNSSEPCSTFAVEQALAGYETLSDATGMLYQQGGHIFYVLTLPTAGVTWVYDVSTELWHQRASGTGPLRWAAVANAFGRVFALDYATGQVFSVSPANPDEAGTPITRQRSFPHILTQGSRARHLVFGVDAQATQPVALTVDWSDDRGASFGSALPLTLDPAASGYARLWRLGLTRDRVYRVTWHQPGVTGLLGAFIDLAPVRG